MQKILHKQTAILLVVIFITLMKMHGIKQFPPLSERCWLILFCYAD